MSKASNRNNFLKKKLEKFARKKAENLAKNAKNPRGNLREKNLENLENSARNSENLAKNAEKNAQNFAENSRGYHKNDFNFAEDLAAAKKDEIPRKKSSFDKKFEHKFAEKSRENAENSGDFYEQPAISEMVREATAGGVIYRVKNSRLEILLVADHFDRWTIPKGHIEEGETAQETAIREIGEEAGVHHLEPICWLGKIHFRYRRATTLVLMSTQIYLFRALGDTDDIQKEDWMNGIKWFDFAEAVEIIAYEDIAKLMILGRNRLKQRGEKFAE